MAIGESKDHVAGFIREMAEVKKFFTGTEEGFTNLGGTFSEILLHAQVEVPAYLRQSSEKYEEGVGIVRTILGMYNEKVLPALDASGLADIEGPKAQEISEIILSLEGFLSALTQRMMGDLFKDNVFESAKSSVADYAESVQDANHGLQTHFLADGAFFPRQQELLATVISEMQAYHDGLG